MNLHSRNSNTIDCIKIFLPPLLTVHCFVNTFNIVLKNVTFKRNTLLFGPLYQIFVGIIVVEVEQVHVISCYKQLVSPHI